LRAIRLHDTRSGKLHELEPGADGRVAIYACGPTVYNRIHIGNARPFVTYLLLARFLRREGLTPVLAYNITDINDKIYDAARPLGIPSAELAREMTAHYIADTNGLELGRPDHEPLASETIDAIVDLTARLVAADHAYASDGDVYFRVRSDPQYGSLSHRSVDDMDQGEEDADPPARNLKEDPLDFALWKAQKQGEDAAWDSPWGTGRPGWHIECSAMAEELLGVGLHIHGGGNDLVFPHHENEAAQTRCAHDGAELARTWMHVGMLQMSGEKMAKSVGNITSLADALEQWGRDAVVLFFSTAHYRQPIAYTDDALHQARRGVARLRELGRRLAPGPSPIALADHVERFFDALADDFGTPAALAALWEWVREANAAADRGEHVGRDDLAEMLEVLGLENLLEEAAPEPDAAARALLERREAARAAKDYAEADRLRDELAELGWQVRDGAGGATLVAR
jgi:cysteinyl-tRNA synthetase